MIAFSKALATIGVWGSVAYLYSLEKGSVVVAFIATAATAMIWQED